MAAKLKVVSTTAKLQKTKQPILASRGGVQKEFATTKEARAYAEGRPTGRSG